MQLGKIEINSPLIMAPLAGYTDSPMRELTREMGAGLTVTELISAEGLVRKSEKTFELLKFKEKERPFSIQLFGNKAETLGEAAKIAEDFEPDLIDINMGCCVPKVTNGGSGAAILQDSTLVYKIASTVKNNVSIPVSAKIRIGWDFQSLNYLENVKALTEAGMEFVAVHGRTRSQRYTGEADWQIINEISQKSSIPVVGNGDIKTYAEAEQRLKETNCSAVMIGRAAIGNPWIFNNTEPTIDQKIATIEKHLNLMLEFYGNYGLILFRKHLVKYISSCRNAAEYRRRLVTTESSEEILTILHQLKEEQ